MKLHSHDLWFSIRGNGVELVYAANDRKSFDISNWEPKGISK